jgi:hypothetical protein
MGGGCTYSYILIGISLGLERGRKVYFRESKNMAIEMTLNQGRLVHTHLTGPKGKKNSDTSQHKLVPHIVQSFRNVRTSKFW